MLDSTTLLAAWEQGSAQSAPHHASLRALTLLAASRPEKSFDQWACATIGARDRALLQLREDLFGTKLDATARCPQCGERLELSFTTRDIAIDAATARSALQLTSGDFHVSCRVPTTADVLDSCDREALLDRCVESAVRSTTSGAEHVPASALPVEITTALATALEQADPQAHVNLALDCPACGAHWQSVFDIVTFLWGEIEDWAQRLLYDVHLLASAYGWSERDIVAMTPRRRRMYLEMVDAL